MFIFLARLEVPILRGRALKIQIRTWRFVDSMQTLQYGCPKIPQGSEKPMKTAIRANASYSVVGLVEWQLHLKGCQTLPTKMTPSLGSLDFFTFSQRKNTLGTFPQGFTAPRPCGISWWIRCPVPQRWPFVGSTKSWC